MAISNCFTRPLIDFYIKNWRGNKRMLTITNSMRDMSVPDKEKFLKERYEFIYEFSKYWK